MGTCGGRSVLGEEKVGSGGTPQRTLKNNRLGKRECVLRGGLEREAQSLVAKGWGSPGTGFSFFEGFIAGGTATWANRLLSSWQKHLVCGPVKAAGAPGTLTAPEYYE